MSFLKKNKSLSLLCLGMVFVLGTSFWTLTTKPKISTDEAISIELARNFQTERVLDIKTAPGVFSGMSERLQSTGYSVTLPLSLFFGMFGYGFAQARVYMILWMIVALSVLFWLGRKWFGADIGVAVFLLLISFASFYANGRTVSGEIPGLLFLLAGLYFLFSREKLLWAGFFLGLAVVSKLSVFALIIPAFVLLYLFEWRKFFTALVPIALGMLPAGIIWIFLNLNQPFLMSTWLNLFRFYKNPYSSQIGSNVAHNILAIPHSTTIIYFGVLFLIVLAARFMRLTYKYTNDTNTTNGHELGLTQIEICRLRRLYNFVIIYGVLAFIYYLRSPGWLRYILIAELLILFLLPHALFLLFERVRDKLPKFLSQNFVPTFLLLALVLVQGVQMFTVSDIFSSDGASRAAQSINENFPGKSVGVLNAIEVAVWLNTSRRYLAMDLTGLPQIGENPLMRRDLPDVIVSNPGQRFLVEGKETVNLRYTIFKTVGGYTIYKLNIPIY